MYKVLYVCIILVLIYSMCNKKEYFEVKSDKKICQSSYNSNKPCCGQNNPPTVNPMFTCDVTQPVCVGYIYSKQLGECYSNDVLPKGPWVDSAVNSSISKMSDNIYTLYTDLKSNNGNYVNYSMDVSNDSILENIDGHLVSINNNTNKGLNLAYNQITELKLQLSQSQAQIQALLQEKAQAQAQAQTQIQTQAQAQTQIQTQAQA